MINIIWGIFLLLGLTYSILSGNGALINDEILKSGTKTLQLMIEIFPVMAIWLGLMNIASTSKLLDKLAKLIEPLLTKLFPDIPKGHSSLGYISSNLIINFFGLGSAATPFGLKSMKSLQELNKEPKKASRSMITFLVLNTTGLTLVPTMIISLRYFYKSTNPTGIILFCFLATLSSTIGGLIIDRIIGSRFNK
ncbi:MAG: nucleoside recognition domain-containing protein [Bacilli bacterium]